MGQVVRLTPKKTPAQEDQEVIVARLEDILQRAKAGELKGFLYGAFTDDPEANVATAWASVDFAKRAELLAHMHMDLTASMVEVNFFTEGGDE